MEHTTFIPQKGITGSTLKLIAIITMTIDHIGAFLLEKLLLASQIHGLTYPSFLAPHMKSGAFLNQLYYTDMVLRCIGRVAFLIFAFLIVEGFLHTHNMRKYASRLFLFALISEIPFSLIGSAKILSLDHLNVFFTLCIGLAVIACFNMIEQKNWKPLPGILIKAAVLALGCLVAYVIKSDYDAFGVAAIALLYLFRSNRRLSVFAGGILLTIMSSIEIFSLVSIIPISLYNGKKGWSMKYFFYFFYPVHLLILYFITYWLGIASVAVF
ncbi:MAG: TraX family protein [Lachnospiraceae bacterium]|nr:TraX family protein [Lachnospiraceae bacterium]